jgi:tetratricopeptide (TPR) repeat protein
MKGMPSLLWRPEMVRLTVLAAVLLVGPSLLPSPLRADEDRWPVPRGASREPAPHVYDPKSLDKVPRAFFDDAVATVLYSGNTHIVEKDGTIETITHEITRLNGRKGIEKLGEYRNIVFAPSYQKLTLNAARIHKAGGKITEVLPRHLHLRDVGTDYLVYDPEKQLIITFPSLEVGDTIEVKWTVRGKNPEHAGQFFSRYSFGDPLYPVVLDEFRVWVPKDRPLKHATAFGKVAPAVTESADGKLYVWKTINTPQSPKDEDLPSKEELRTTLMVSTFSSWEEVGNWKIRLRAECWKCTPEVEAVVKKVTAGLKSPLDKARALTYWVRRNVRYVSVGDKHDYTPHPPAKVLANRYGDCKDTTQLLAVMLRQVGVKVELATLGTYDDGQIDRDVPSPWGTHAILLASIDGTEHWIDTTAQLAGWDFLPRDDSDRVCYLTDEKGKIRLSRTPKMTPEQNRIDQTTDVWIGADGSSRCRRVCVSSGMSAMSQRDAFVEVPPGERRRQVTAELQDSNSRTRLLSLDVDEEALRNHDRPVAVRMDFEIPKQFAGTPDREGSVTDSKVWSKLLAHNIDPDRQVPLVLPAPCETVHRYRFHLPAAWELDALPRAKKLRCPWGRFTVRTRALDNPDGALREVEVTFQLRIDNPRVEAADLEDFRTFTEDVSREYRVWLTLRQVTGINSAPLLESLLAVSPQNGGAAATLARIYLRAGKTADARRVLDRACYYTPDEAALWELRVQAADKADDELKAQRELVKRFPDEPRYGVALGDLLVSAGKHDEARELLEELTDRGAPSSRALAHYHLARSYYRKDELKEALAELDEAAQADAETVNLRALILRGQVLEELKRPADAIAAYRKALESDRDNQTALLSLIRLSLTAKDRAASLDYLRRYTLVAGKDVSGLLLAADAYFSLKRYDDAFELASRARDIGFHEKAQRILGLIHLSRGEDDKALLHLDRAEPDSVVLAGLLEACVRLGKVREVETYLDKAGRLDRPSPALVRALSRERALLKRRAELSKLVEVPKAKQAEYAAGLDALACAEELYRQHQPLARVDKLLERACKPDLAIGPALALRARLSLEHGKLGPAMADADRAIELSPRDAGGFLVRGRVRMERLAAGALADLEKAAELTGRKDADVLGALAECLAQAGRYDDAVSAQKAAVELRPRDEVLLAQLKALEKAAREKGGGR